MDYGESETMDNNSGRNSNTGQSDRGLKQWWTANTIRVAGHLNTISLLAAYRSRNPVCVQPKEQYYINNTSLQDLMIKLIL